MRFVALSDTHGKHHFELPPGDVLLHAGDVSSRGSKTEVQGFLDWFSSLDYPYKIFIAGNHDFFFE
jgi:3',5'-cyclic AMP phosphodiesterase CpdA